MKIIIALLLVASIASAQYILNPPIVETQLCPTFVVVPGDVDYAIATLEAKGCDVIVKDSELSAAHIIIYGVRMDEVGLSF